MKKSLLFFVFALTISTYSYTQIDFNEVMSAGLPAVSQGSSTMADVDGDGDIDVFLTGNNGGTYISQLYLNDGSGVFTTSSNSFVGVSTSNSHFFDADGDGDSDIIYFGFDQSLNRITKLYFNNGSGNFTEDTMNSFTSMNKGDIVSSDVDGDGDVDLLLSGEIGATGTTELYLNDGSGGFTVTNDNLQDVAASTLLFEDLDNDNDDDLVLLGFNQGIYYGITYSNDGSGNFSVISDFEITGVAFGAISAADFNGDGYIDISVSGRDNTSARITHVYINDQDATFTNFQSLEGVEEGSMNTSDINGDGFFDILYNGISTSNVSVTRLYYNDGNGIFSPSSVQFFDNVYNRGHQLLADLDNDGDSDVLLLGADFNTGSAVSKVYLNIPLDNTSNPDYNALIAFYNSTNGANWINNSGWLDNTVPINQWFGLVFNGNDRVSQINLNFNNLTGTLPTEIGDFNELTQIDVRENSISGNIPTELANISNLNYVDIRFNQFSGSIPAQLANTSTLFVFVATSNQLSGTVPDFTNIANTNGFLWLENNNFQFGDFELNQSSNSIISNYLISPQSALSLDTFVETNIGGSETLEAISSGANNQYQWYLDNSPIAGETGATLQLDDIQDTQLGGYRCDVTNTIVQNLTLQTGTTTIAVRPDNDLIENAIEVTGVNFIDENVRLDFASADGIGGSDCGVDSFQRVYYKFTATAFVSITMSITDPNFQAINNSFLIPYTAPDLNQTNENQLLVLPGYCIFGNTTTFTTTPGQSYYIQVHRGADTGQVSNINFDITEDSSQAERDALIAFYNANGGVNWTNSMNWNTTQPVGAWHGVTVTNGQVTNVELFSNNLVGNDLTALLNLPALERLDINNNSLSGTIPDFSVLPNLEFLRIGSNDFSFADFETNFTQNQTIEVFSFSPQNIQDVAQEIEGIIGNDYTFTMTPIAGTDVDYQWFIGGATADGDEISGATSNTYTITNTQTEDLNLYYCVATSPLVPGLTYRIPSINLFGEVSQAERDALMVFYNALDGPNWGDNTNWGTAAPVKDWAHVTTAGNKVVILNFFGVGGLTGQIPSEIENLIHLENLSIGVEAGVTGPLPASIGNLSQLKRLRIQGTGNSGSLPASIGNLSSLIELRLIGNAFTGDIPSTFNNLTSLTDFYVIGSVFDFGGNFNLFTGALPSFANSPDLFRIQVSGNDFTGELPDYGVLPNMNQLFIDDNMFSFANLQTNQISNLTIENYIFSPQRNNSEPETIETAPGESITLNANGSTTTGRIYWERLNTDQYQWFKDDIAINGATEATYTIANPQPSDSGVYFCEITNTTVDGLVVTRADITLNVNAALSIDDVELTDFKLYPNPATNWITISANGLQDARTGIYDISGRLVQKSKLTSNTTALNIETLTSGIYILKITSLDNKTESKRFVKR